MISSLQSSCDHRVPTSLAKITALWRIQNAQDSKKPFSDMKPEDETKTRSKVLRSFSSQLLKDYRSKNLSQKSHHKQSSKKFVHTTIIHLKEPKYLKVTLPDSSNQPWNMVLDQPPYFLTWACWLGPTWCRITISRVLDHAQGCGMGRRAVEPIW